MIIEELKKGDILLWTTSPEEILSWLCIYLGDDMTMDISPKEITKCDNLSGYSSVITNRIKVMK